MGYAVHIALFPDAPDEVHEFPTLKDAHTFAVRRKVKLKHEYYTITIEQGGYELESHQGSIYRGLHR
jgi:hypothetical protein